MMIITCKRKKKPYSALSRICYSTLHPHISGYMKPFYKHMALGFRSTHTCAHTIDMLVNKDFHVKDHENMNATTVNHRLVTAMDTQE